VDEGEGIRLTIDIIEMQKHGEFTLPKDSRDFLNVREYDEVTVLIERPSPLF